LKQDLGILSFFAQKVMPFKNQGNFDLSKTLTGTLTAGFGELVQGASQTVQFGTGLGGNEIMPEPLNNLKQQISVLAKETEDLLANALEQNATPETVEDILSQAVTQLWNLIENFDVKNGTNHVLALSEILVQQGPNSIVPQESAETARQPLPQVATQALLLDNNETIFTQVSNLLGRSQIFSKNIQPPIINSQADIQTATADPMKTVFSPEARPSQSGAFEIANIQITQTAGSKGDIHMAYNSPKPVPAEALHNNRVSERNITTQPTLDLASTVSKSNAMVATFVAGVDIKAKAKELVLATAQRVIVNTEIPTSSNDTSASQFHPKVEALSGSSVTPSEPARIASNFAQSIANQTQGKAFNQGLTRIELAPRGLGNIVIDLQTQESGEIQVMLRVENPAVLNALRTNREALLTLLSNGGVSSENVSLDFEEFNQGQFNRDEGQIAPDNIGSHQESDSDNPDELESTTARTEQLLADGRLDIFT